MDGKTALTAGKSEPWRSGDSWLYLLTMCFGPSPPDELRRRFSADYGSIRWSIIREGEEGPHGERVRRPAYRHGTAVVQRLRDPARELAVRLALGATRAARATAHPRDSYTSPGRCRLRRRRRRLLGEQSDWESDDCDDCKAPHEWSPVLTHTVPAIWFLATPSAAGDTAS